MAMTGSNIATDVRNLLFDVAGNRWIDDELIAWINAGQREAAVLKPECCAKTVSLTMLAGTRQLLPTDAISMIDAPRNMGADGLTAGRVIRTVARDILDSTSPDWHTETPAAIVKNIIYDVRNPKVFYCYPPQVGGTSSIELIYGANPVDLVLLADEISISNEYANCLVDYVCYRALTKDFEDSNPQRAMNHYTQFANTLGVTLANSLSRSPNVMNLPFNPDVPAAAR